MVYFWQKEGDEMINKEELKKQIEEIKGICIEGRKVEDLLLQMEKEGVFVCWGDIPPAILYEKF